MKRRTKTRAMTNSPRTHRQPTGRGVMDYLAAKRPGAARVRSEPRPAAGGVSPRRAGPTLALALDRADEFPRFIEIYDEGDVRDRNVWRFDVRLDMVRGQTLYRCWSVTAVTYAGAVQSLGLRAGDARVVTIFAVRRPPTLEDLDRIDAANVKLERVRRRCGPWATVDDLGKRVAQLAF